MAFSDIGANPAWGTNSNKRLTVSLPTGLFIRSEGRANTQPGLFLCKLYGLGITELNGVLQPAGGGGSPRPSTGIMWPRGV